MTIPKPVSDAVFAAVAENIGDIEAATAAAIGLVTIRTRSAPKR